MGGADMQSSKEESTQYFGDAYENDCLLEYVIR
jgi:hypothetical protein